MMMTMMTMMIVVQVQYQLDTCMTKHASDELNDNDHRDEHCKRSSGIQN